MKELSVGEQRYKAVMAVLSGGRTVTEVARDWEVSRQTCMRGWLATSEKEWVRTRKSASVNGPVGGSPARSTSSESGVYGTRSSGRGSRSTEGWISLVPRR
jgi:hypothetical protein